MFHAKTQRPLSVSLRSLRLCVRTLLFCGGEHGLGGLLDQRGNDVLAGRFGFALVLLCEFWRRGAGTLESHVECHLVFRLDVLRHRRCNNGIGGDDRSRA